MKMSSEPIIISTAKQHIEVMANFFRQSKMNDIGNYYDWILANGKEYTNLPLTGIAKSKTEKYLRFNNPMPKMCYANSADFALRYKDVGYCEGFGVSIIPCEHAWNVIDGQLVDNTWRFSDIEGKSYFGVIVPKNLLKKVMKIDDGMTILQTLYIKGYGKELETDDD
jgi:hypothetical protein